MTDRICDVVVLCTAGVSSDRLRSKRSDEFAAPGAPCMRSRIGVVDGTPATPEDPRLG